MAKKNVDINLFNAASKTDKKIQTGVSKGFMSVIACFVIVFVIVGYIGLIFIETQDLKTKLAEYKNNEIYYNSINELGNRIEADTRLLASIQADINSANAIKEFVYSNSVIYPGITNAQKTLLLTKQYKDPESGLDKQGCVPTEVIIDTANRIGIEISYTDGMSSYTTIRTNDLDEDVVDEVVFEKGYVIIKYQVASDTIAGSVAEIYVNNIINMAPSVFAIEDDVTNRENIGASSFETGYFSKPTAEKPNANYEMYIKCKLKSIFQIISEDTYLNLYTSIEKMNFTNNALTLEVNATKNLYEIARYLNNIGLFIQIGYAGEQILVTEAGKQYKGNLICLLKGDELA